MSYPHYNVTKSNEHHQFDILYVPHNLFEGNRYKSIYQVLILHEDIKSLDHLRPKNQAKLHLCWKQSMFKYPKAFQCDNGSEFKNEVTKLLEKHNVDIQRATTKYKHTHTAFVEAFNRELAKLLFKPMDAQELQDPMYNLG